MTALGANRVCPNGHTTHAGVCPRCLKTWRLTQRGPLLRETTITAEPLLSMLQDLPKTRTRQLDKAVWRARRSGTFTLAQADELCVKYLLRHPAEVYGEAWWAA